MGEYLRLAAAALVGLILVLVVGRQSKDLSLLLSLAVCVLLCLGAMEFLEPVLERTELPRELGRQLQQLGETLGRFALPGQLRGLEGAIRSAEDALRRIRDGADGRRRSWQTLGLCAGAALAILFV